MSKLVSVILTGGKSSRMGYENKSFLKIKDINMVKKHVKTTKEKKGGIFSKESFVHISNLKLVDEKIKSKKTEAKK